MAPTCIAARRCIAMLAVTALCSVSAEAQETVNLASVSGRVLDPQAAVVSGAVVSARHTETNVTAETVTDADGRFRFPYLRVGPYEVRVHAPGFADSSRTLVLTVGSAFDMDVALSLAAVEATLNVAGNTTILEAVRSQIAGTVAAAEVQNLPMNGRNFLDLSLLVPGVSPTNIGSTQLFAETSAVPGQGISISSQRNLSNSFIVDGLSANDDAAGLSGIPYGVDAVEQFQVVTSGGQAELGRALGGYINVVTKSGTNTMHGTLYDFIRDDNFNAANALSHTTLPMNQQQFGASLGGPIVSSRTFYFANVEQRLLDQTGLVTILPENVPIINDALVAVAYPGPPVTTGIYPNPVQTSNVLGKIDHQISGADQLAVRYGLYRVTSDNSRGAGALNGPTASASLDNVDHSVAFGNTWTISPRMVNETRAQFAYGDLQAPPTDPIGPAVSIAGVASFGTSSGSPTKRINRMYQVVDNLSYQAGEHAFRAGVDVLYNDDTITYPRSYRGSYTFPSLAAFLSGAYSGFTQTFGDPVVSQNNPNIGMYAQDEWRVGSALTLNLGLRYDLQFLEIVDTDTDNVSPRVGFAWSPSSSHDVVVRGNAGVFFDRVPLRAVANAILSADNTTDLDNLHQPSVSSIIPSQAGAPTFPDILQARILTTTLVDFTTMDRNLQNAHSRQASLEVERSLGRGRTVSLGYQYLRGYNLLMSVNQNIPTCVAAGTNNGCRPQSSYRNNSQYSSVGDSTYHGLHVSFVQRPAAWAGIRVGYTFSKSMNDLGEAFFSQPIDPTDIKRDWGRSDDDQRHRVVINGTVNTSMAPATTTWARLTHGYQASAMVQYYSALPFNITSGVANLQGTASRPLAGGATAAPNFDVRAVTFIPRNAGTGSDFFTLNLRVSRGVRLAGSFRLDGLVEAFNLTNRVNIVTRNVNFGPGAYPTNPVSTFNQTTAVGEPRTIQFGARLSF
ncbi:MAG TPA: TonB-dependent receptor [Vicinamibacterales bacterium]|nr:TonB-dependent receptor [Vicinamibacterales bacterium]